MKQMNPPIPLMTRRAVLLRAKHACEDCGNKTTPLSLHHLTYQRMAHDGPQTLFGKETPDDLAVLCWDCHKARHRVWGQYYEDPEEADYVRERLDLDKD
jgi:5-methylcytosine-specific restriction endonuclease McrA